MTDARLTVELLGRARAGEAAALDDLLERYRERLLARIRLMMGAEARRHAESMDFLQGVLLEVARDLARAEVPDEAAFLRWATRVARNNIRDHMRKRRERALESFSQTALGALGPGSAGPADATPSRHAGSREEVEKLVEALERLSPDHRRVIELRDFEGLSCRETAREMDRPSEEAVQMLHARALARLTRELVRD